MTPQAMTVQEISSAIGITPRAVRTKAGIDAYFAGRESSGGRPADLYRSDVLELWQTPKSLSADEATRRRNRSDEGLPRKCTREQWDAIVCQVRALYVQSAQANLKLACEVASRSAVDAWPVTHKQVYRRLNRTDLGSDHKYLSEYRSEGWEYLRLSHLRKADMAKKYMPTTRQDIQSLMESMTVAGAGFGAMSLWVLDLRKNDAWTSDGITSSIYIMCGLTGMPLWVEPVPGRTETKADVARAIMKCAFAWGKRPTVGFALDNGSAMKSEEVRGLLATLLPDSAWECAEMFPELFHDGTPIVRNLPNIPRAPWKARLERQFKQIKDEHDATMYANAYQGGSRMEAIQHSISSQLTLPRILSSSDQYNTDLGRYLWGDYIQRERPAMFPLFVERGMTPSIGNVFQYYHDPTSNLPKGEEVAYLLYHAMRASNRAGGKVAVVTAELGHASATIAGKSWHLVHSAFGRGVVGQKVAIVPIPGMNEAIVMLVGKNPNDPRYLCTCENFIIRDVSQLPLRRKAMDVQNAIRADLRSGLKDALQPDANGNRPGWGHGPVQPTQPQLPSGAGWIDAVVEEVTVEEDRQAARHDVRGTDTEGESRTAGAIKDDPIEVSPEMADFLSDLADDLS